MQQPIADIAFSAAPWVLLALAAGAVYLALLSTVHAEALARVRAYRKLRGLVETLERTRPPGTPRPPRLAAATARLEALRETLARDGILPAASSGPSR